MVIVPAGAPQQLPSTGGFDYVVIDPVHRRMYAAHTFAGRLLVVDTDTGKLLGEVETGDIHGIAYDAHLDTVYVGVGEDDHAIAEVNPRTLKVVRRVQVPGHVDAIAYDPKLHRIYADEDSGTRVFVVDSAAFRYLATVKLPGEKPEYPVVDPHTHDLIQNIDEPASFAVIDGRTDRVIRDVRTSGLQHNHGLQYDAQYHQVVVGATNYHFATYRPDGTHLATLPFPSKLDQCSLDERRHEVACGRGEITLIQLTPDGVPKVIAQGNTAPEVKTMAIDAKTGDIWVVWAKKTGRQTAYYQRYMVKR